MPVNDAESWDRPLTDVLVDHIGLLHPGLRTGIDAVLDLDDGRRPRADPAGVALRRHLDDGGERQLPVGRQRVLLAVDRSLRDRQLVLSAVAQLEAEGGALPVARPRDGLVVGLAVQRDRCLGAVHRLGEIDLDVAGRLYRLLAVDDRLAVNHDGRNHRRGLGFEAETAGDATPGRVLRVLDADVIGGVRRHVRPELEFPRADGLERDQHRRAEAEGVLHGVGLHVLVEVKVDGSRSRNRLVTVVDVGVHLERSGDDANHDGSRHHEDGDRGQPPAFAKCLCPGH